MEEAVARTAETLDADAPAAAGRTRYEDDLYSWVQEQVALLRAERTDGLDLDDIAEELSDVGSGQYGKVESAVEVSIAHMLKWDHQPERRTRSWTQTIEQHRLRIGKPLRKNLGLKSRSTEALDDGFRLGRVRAAREMKRETRSLPSECPDTWDDILNRPSEFDADR